MLKRRNYQRKSHIMMMVVRMLALSLLMTGSLTALAAWPPKQCTHVQVLSADDGDQVNWKYDGSVIAYKGTLEDAESKQLDVLAVALDLLPEIICKAVRKVAFINRPPGTDIDERLKISDAKTVVGGWTNSEDRPTTVYLNSNRQMAWNNGNLKQSEYAKVRAIQRFVHESTHVAQYLLQSQQRHEPMDGRDRPDPDSWPADVQQMARDIIASNRLNIGVIREWTRMHNAFVAFGMAEPYYGNGWQQKDGFSAEALATAGFTSAYGGKSAVEDLAEITGWAIVNAKMPEALGAACEMMGGRTGSSIVSADAAVFTKLGFAYTLKFIPESVYKACIGPLEIDASGQGFYSFKSGVLDHSYTGNPKAGADEFSDPRRFIFNLAASGTATTTSEASVPVRTKLLLNITPSIDGPMSFDDLGYPRGVYPVGHRTSQWNRLQLSKLEDRSLLVEVAQGVALVGLASSEGIVGSVAVQTFFNFSGGLLSSIAGDAPVTEPTNVTFRYDPD